MSLARALQLAGEAVGRAYPKPTVGAVVMRDGEVVGEGVTEQGGRHAEVVALDAAARAGAAVRRCSSRSSRKLRFRLDAAFAPTACSAREWRASSSAPAIRTRKRAAGSTCSVPAVSMSSCWIPVFPASRTREGAGSGFVSGARSSRTRSRSRSTGASRCRGGTGSRARRAAVSSTSCGLHPMPLPRNGDGACRRAAPRCPRRTRPRAASRAAWRSRQGPALPAGFLPELELRSGPLADELRSLAAEGVQSLLLEGGPTLAGAFLDADLVDKLRRLCISARARGVG